MKKKEAAKHMEFDPKPTEQQVETQRAPSMEETEAEEVSEEVPVEEEPQAQEAGENEDEE